VSLAVAGALRAHCHHEAALKWYELVYNPFHRDDKWSRCEDDHVVPRDEPRDPRDEPRDEPPAETGEPPREEPPDRPRAIALSASRDTRRPRPTDQPRDRDADTACCPQLAVDDDDARNRALLLHHLETMLQWGDALMCRNAPEAFRQAEVIFDTIDGVLGASPRTIFAADAPAPAPTVAAFTPRPAPLNPRLMALYERTADRRALVHACLNARRLRHGRPSLDMPYFGDDPRREGSSCDACSCCDCGDCVACCDAYRFTFRLQKATELAAEVRALGSELLSAYEKRDGEHLGALRASHERQLLELALDIRKGQWRDADWQVQALRKTKEGAQTRLRYYRTMLANGLIGGEIAYESLTGSAMDTRAAANISSAIGQAMTYIPDFAFGVAGVMGTPLQISQLPLGTKLGTAFTIAATILNTIADIQSTNAGLNLTRAGWDRREEEWRHQVEVIGIEIEQIERQILGSERRRDMALRELDNHQRQIEHSIEVQDFLRDKFTNHQLYLFLQQETAALYYQTYEIALQAARQAERAFNYERGHTTRSFVPDDTWDGLRNGLLAGERLQLAVRRMEKAYLDENCREYELTKHISLRLNAPLSFVELRATGYCEIELPEWMFDLDYPGQYMRRIKNVTVSIPAVVGPYTGVHCRLTLLSSTTRIDPRLRKPPVECCGEPCSCECNNSCCACDPPPSGYAPLPDDPRIVRAYAATEAIATSSGQNDSGLFELSFRDERYLPFEFAGAVSRWRIELPPETNYFDFDSLSDVVLHLNYTAREGGDVLRAAASSDARARLPGDGLRLFDVRRDMSDAWNELRRPAAGDQGHGGHDHGGHGTGRRRLPLRLSNAMFPFVPGRRVRWVDALTILFEAPDAEPSTNHVVRFYAAEHRHDHGEECDCDRTDVHCVASDEYPGLFWGVLDLRGRRLGPFEGDRPTALGTFAFPEELGEICEVHLVAKYCADPWPSCGKPEDPCGCRSELLPAASDGHGHGHGRGDATARRD